MKNIVLILCSILTFSVSAQKTITVTGKFKKNYRTVNPTKQLQRALFILEKGDICFPEGGLFDQMYFLKLSAKDAKRLDTEVILVYPFFDTKITYIYDTPITLELISIPNLPDCYYSKKASCAQVSSTYPENLPLSKMSKIKAGKTDLLQERRADFRNLPEWIGALDNDKKVPFMNFRRVYLTNGTERTDEVPDSIALSDLAKEKMDDVAYFLKDVIPLPEKPTKEDWQQWWKKLQEFKIETVKNNAHIETFKEADRDQIFGFDEQKQKVYALHCSPIVNNYHDRELLIFNTLNNKVTRAYIYHKTQREATDFVNVYAQNDTLYTLNKSMQWAKYFPTATDSLPFYKQLAINSLLPSAEKEKVSDIYRIIDIHNTPTHTQLFYQKRHTEDFFVMCIDTRTGKLLQNIALKTLFPNTQTLAYVYTKASESAVLTLRMKTEKDIYELAFKEGKLVKKELLPADSKSVTGKLLDKNYVQGIEKIEGKHLNIFYEFIDPLFIGVRMQVFDKESLTPIGKPINVYQYLPEEEISSDNEIQLEAVFKSARHWNVFLSGYKKIYWIVF